MLKGSAKVGVFELYFANVDALEEGVGKGSRKCSTFKFFLSLWNDVLNPSAVNHGVYGD